MLKLREFIKTKGAVLQYGDYYNSYKEELIKLLEYYKAMGYHVAIWGAGLKGKAFLNCIDREGKYIQTVIDLNQDLHDKFITSKHKVVSLTEALIRNPDIIFIMSSFHYADNNSLLRDSGYHGKIIDLDYLIENNIKFEAIIQNRVDEGKESKSYDLSSVHKKLLEILLEIDRICKKHHITYFLSAGTALGAARHKGFIPWDDDADIGMLRDDFEKFRKIAKKELESKFYYQTMKDGGRFYRAFDQIGIKNTAFVLYHTKDIKIRHGIHVDIFPFDYVSDDEESRNEHVREVQLYRSRIYNKLVPHVVETRNVFKKLFINFDYYKMKFVPLLYLYKKQENILTKNRGKEENYVADLLTHYKKVMYFKKEDMIPVNYVEFEQYQFPVPKNLDAYLTMMYGDYMTPPPEGKRFQRHRIVKLSTNEAYDKDQILFKDC